MTARRQQQWPASLARRWALRLAISAPMVGLALWAHYRGYNSPGLVSLDAQAAHVRAGLGDLSGLKYGFPPLAVLLGFLPGDQVALSVLSALCSGYLVQTLISWGRVRHNPRWVQAVAFLPLLATPVCWYMMCEEPVWIVTFTLIAIALNGWQRFTVLGQTEGGFVAGIALSFAVCTDMVATGIVIMVALAVPVFARQRYRHQPQATLATLAVLLFPSAAALAGWAFVEWRFAGTIMNQWRLSWTGTPFTAASQASPYDLLTFAPYLVFWAAVGINYLLKRQSLAFAAYLVPELALAAMRLLAWPYMQQGKSYLLLVILAVAGGTLNLGTPSRLGRAVIVAGAVAQVVIIWRWPPSTSSFHSWWQHVT